MTRWILNLFLLSAVFGSACNSIEYSPNQAFDNDSPVGLNNTNLARLAGMPADDTIRFVLTGDSQRQYSNAEDLVKVINKIPGVDFVLLDGDISDFGLLQEMEWVNQIFAKLKMPYIGVIGNHDLVANGEEVFRRMFGDLNFSFVYSGVKFICHNTNSREADFNKTVPDLPWLRKQFEAEAGVSAYIPVAHVPPNHEDFDDGLSEEYINIINGSPNTLAALYAHTHKNAVFYPRQDSIPYIISNAIEHRMFVLVEIVNGRLSFRNVEY